MSSLTNYRGLQVFPSDAPPPGGGGLAISNNFTDLVNWHPLSQWAQTGNPTAGDDQTQNYYPGSLWLNSSTNELFLCFSSAPGAAVWQQVILAPINQGAGNAINPSTNSMAVGINSVAGDGFVQISSISGDTVTLVAPGFPTPPLAGDRLLFTNQSGTVIRTVVVTVTSSVVFTVTAGSLNGMGSGYICDYSNISAAATSAVAVGENATAIGSGSMAFGYGTLASNSHAFALGFQASANGIFSLALGNITNASGAYSFSFGLSDQANSDGSVAMGLFNTADGAYSTAVGFGNSATGPAAFTAGRQNTGSAAYSTAIGDNNSVPASGTGGVALGINNTASGIHSVAVGYSNNSTGPYAVALGQLNTASGANTFVAGNQNTSSGAYSFAFGLFCTTDGMYSMAVGNNCHTYAWASTALGFFAKSSLYGQFSNANGMFANWGDAQTSQFILRNSTATATPANLFLDGSSSVMTLPTNQTTWGFTATVSAYDQTDNYAGRWKIEGCVVMDNNGNVALVGSPSVTSWVSAGFTGSATCGADNTAKALQVQVSGMASKTIRWVAKVSVEQVSFGMP